MQVYFYGRGDVQILVEAPFVQAGTFTDMLASKWPQGNALHEATYVSRFCLGTGVVWSLRTGRGEPPCCACSPARQARSSKGFASTSQARRRQLRASSGGSSEAKSKASFPLHNTEARQHQRTLECYIRYRFVLLLLLPFRWR